MPFAKRHSPTAYQMFTYTAVGAETSFTGSDDNSNTLSYDPATVVCYIDGVKLLAADYTATDGTNITGIAAMTAGQTFEAEAIGDSGNPIVSYTKAAADAKYALLGANSDITSLTGLTTPLSEAQGGTGLTSLPTSDGTVGVAFLCENSVEDNNITGDGTLSGTLDFDTERFDVGGDFASDTFTAPSTGKYLLGVTLLMGGVLTSHDDTQVQIITSNRTYKSERLNAGNCVAGDLLDLNFCILCDMDTSDTAIVKVQIAASTLVCDLRESSRFWGMLVA